MAKDRVLLLEQAQRLKQLRRPLPNGRSEVTQQAAADAAGVTLRAYQQWEAGDNDISWASLQSLASYYGVEPRWIAHGDQEPSQMDRIEAKLDAIMHHLQIDAEPPIPEGVPFGPAVAESRARPDPPNTSKPRAPKKTSSGR